MFMNKSCYFAFLTCVFSPFFSLFVSCPQFTASIQIFLELLLIACGGVALNPLAAGT